MKIKRILGWGAVGFIGLMFVGVMADPSYDLPEGDTAGPIDDQIIWTPEACIHHHGNEGGSIYAPASGKYGLLQERTQARTYIQTRLKNPDSYESYEAFYKSYSQIWCPGDHHAAA
ncbi:MAG: hypothetical protein AB3N28_09520 [Kordiimonas sp.]